MDSKNVSVTHILRFPTADDTDNVLVSAEISKSGIYLIGTEGYSQFYGDLKHDDLVKYKSAQGGYSDEEWIVLVNKIFNRERVSGIDVVAELNGKLNLVFRKTAEGFSVRLGSILLEENDDDEGELSVLDWCHISVKAHEATESRLHAAEKENVVLMEKIALLENLVSEIKAARDKDEQILLVKMAALLNEKKAKIREQHTMLLDANKALLDARANVKQDVTMGSPEVETEEPEVKVPAKASRGSTRGRARGTTRGRGRGRLVGVDTDSALVSRTLKRKAVVAAVDSDEDSEFERPVVDKGKGKATIEDSEDEETGDGETTDDGEMSDIGDDTESDGADKSDFDDDGDVTRDIESEDEGGLNLKPREANLSGSHQAASELPPQPLDDDDDMLLNQPPPTRLLPFGKSHSKKKQVDTENVLANPEPSMSEDDL